MVGRDGVALEELLALQAHRLVVELDHLPVGIRVGSIALAQPTVVTEHANGEVVALGRFRQDEGERAALDVAAPLIRVVDLGDPAAFEPARQVATGQAPDLLQEPVAHQLRRLRQGQRSLAMTKAVGSGVLGQSGRHRSFDLAHCVSYRSFGVQGRTWVTFRAVPSVNWTLPFGVVDPGRAAGGQVALLLALVGEVCGRR